MNGVETWLERHWKILRELTALVALIVAFAALGYHYLTDVRPALLAVERLSAHEKALDTIGDMARGLEEHRKWEWETYRVSVLQCRAIRQMARLDPEQCGPDRSTRP